MPHKALTLKPYQLFAVLWLLSGTVVAVKMGSPLYLRHRAHQIERAQYCPTVPPLTKNGPNDISVEDTEPPGITQWGDHGVEPYKNTFVKKVSLPDDNIFPVVVYPEALSPDIWNPLSLDAIAYIGKGGEAHWHDWISPDRYYWVDVPQGATALAFGRLCYRNGDVGVIRPVTLSSHRRFPWVKGLSPTTLIVNNKVRIKGNTSPNDESMQFPLLVNAGSNVEDALVTQTEVYYTTRPVNFTGF